MRRTPPSRANGSDASSRVAARVDRAGWGRIHCPWPELSEAPVRLRYPSGEPCHAMEDVKGHLFGPAHSFGHARDRLNCRWRLARTGNELVLTLGPARFIERNRLRYEPSTRSNVKPVTRFRRGAFALVERHVGEAEPPPLMRKWGQV